MQIFKRFKCGKAIKPLENSGFFFILTLVLMISIQKIQLNARQYTKKKKKFESSEQTNSIKYLKSPFCIFVSSLFHEGSKQLDHLIISCLRQQLFNERQLGLFFFFCYAYIKLRQCGSCALIMKVKFSPPRPFYCALLLAKCFTTFQRDYRSFNFIDAKSCIKIRA